MSGLEELKKAYHRMSDEYSYEFIKYAEEDCDGAKYRELTFRYFKIPDSAVFTYGFFTDNDPDNDDVTFRVLGDDNFVLLTVGCLHVISEFINTMNKNRSDKATIDEFINYLNTLI